MKESLAQASDEGNNYSFRRCLHCTCHSVAFWASWSAKYFILYQIYLTPDDVLFKDYNAFANYSNLGTAAEREEDKLGGYKSVPFLNTYLLESRVAIRCRQVPFQTRIK